jgi:hypothetical protein
MSVREAINGNKVLGIGVGLILIAIAVGAAVYYGGQSKTDLEGGGKAFYTVDDGKTWFVDDANKIPPFDHEGKTAYRCYLFTPDGGKTKFVSHLERYTAEGRKAAESQAGKGSAGALLARRLSAAGIEIKRPLTGDTGWIPHTSPAAGAMMRPQLPDGSPLTNAEPVWP